MGDVITVGARLEHDAGRGVGVVERPRERVLRFTTRGHLSKELAAFAMTNHKAVIDAVRAGDAAAKLACFYDWSGMTSYDGPARTDSSKFAIENRDTFSCLVIVTTSPIVTMGVTVANMIVGGFLQATTDLDKFNRLYDQAITRG